jgi:hypothetical protein
MGLHDDGYETITRENAKPEILSKEEFDWCGDILINDMDIIAELSVIIENGELIDVSNVDRFLLSKDTGEPSYFYSKEYAGRNNEEAMIKYSVMNNDALTNEILRASYSHYLNQSES